MKPLVILGAGGYAQELLWIVDDVNAKAPTWDFLGFIDPANPGKAGQTHYDRPILGGYDALKKLPRGTHFACGVGTPDIRKKECDAAEQLGLTPATLVHPTVVVARHVEIGAGTAIGAGSICAPYARIGRHCAINLHVSVGHDAVVGDYCVLSPGARISGGARLEGAVFLGTNATVYLKRRVGQGASLGANSFLLSNLKARQSAIGVPARAFAVATGAGTCSVQEQRSQAKEGNDEI